VNDEEDIVELIRYNLEKGGFDVLPAMDGERALELVRNTGPDLVILDLMLPVIAGLELCHIVRKDPKTAHIPIIMLTAKL
jgi:DNA-binding response OmpR family regulator